MAKSTLPRGIRNFNPGNIRKGDNWDGLDIEKTKLEKDFCVFTSPIYGIRALTKILVNYNVRYGLCTVYDILNRYAPAVENDTNSYISHVARILGVDPKEKINVKTPYVMKCFIKAIIKHENGQQPYLDAEIEEGMALAGIK